MSWRQMQQRIGDESSISELLRFARLSDGEDELDDWKSLSSSTYKLITKSFVEQTQQY